MADTHRAIHNPPASKLAAALSVLVYPGAMLACCVAAWWLLYPLNFPVAAILLPVATAFAICLVLERYLPYRAAWQPSRAEVRTDAAYIGVNLALREGVTLVIKLGALGLLAGVAPTLPGTLWPITWHPLLQMLLAVLALDFFEYWFHRASHRNAFLWRFHAVHHSPDKLYFFNASRFHAVDWLVLIIIEVAVLLALGAPAKVVALALVFVQVHGLFQHANIRLRLGPLNYLVSGPELHRWHHSKLAAESDHNYGNNVIIWDLLFGSFYWPREREVGALGLLNPKYPQSFTGQLRAPLNAGADKPSDYANRKQHYINAVHRENRALAGADHQPSARHVRPTE